MRLEWKGFNNTAMLLDITRDLIVFCYLHQISGSIDVIKCTFAPYLIYLDKEKTMSLRREVKFPVASSGELKKRKVVSRTKKKHLSLLRSIKIRNPCEMLSD